MEERHLGAQTPEGLRQLAADGTGPDDGQAPRLLGQSEHGFVGEEAAFAEARHLRVVGASARSNDGLLESQARAVDLDCVRPGEVPVPQEDVDPEALEALGGVVVAEPRADAAHALTPSAAAARISPRTLDDRMTAFDGTQPTLRQSPPRRSRSMRATRAPRPAAPAAVTSPAVPPPMTTRL